MAEGLSSVKFALSDVPESERSLIKKRLLLLGYKYYCSELETPSLDLVKATKLLEKPIRKTSPKKVILSKASSTNSSKKEPEVSESANKLEVSSPMKGDSGELRRSRPDSMKNFPFTDGSSSVEDVLKDKSAAPPKFIKMGVAARKRLADKVYKEYTMGRSAMALESIPEGLRTLGLTITSESEQVFKDASDKKLASGSRSNITGSQWFAIVERYVSSEVDKEKRALRKAIDTERREALSAMKAARDELDGEGEGGEAAVDTSVDVNDDAEGDEDEGAAVAAWEEQGEEADEEVIEEVVTTKVTRRPAPYQARKAKARGLQPPKGTRTTNMRNARSRIGEDVRADRQHYARVKMERAQARLEALGRKRVDEVVSDDEDGAQNTAAGEDDESKPIYSWAEDIGLVPPSERRLAASNMDARKRSTHTQKRVGKPVTVGHWASDTTSGSAALEIADAFFGGPIGKELMREDPEADSTHPFADVLGLDDEAGLGQQHKTVAQREEVAKKAEDAKNMYAEGWAKTKGGWVADFGAPHTHLISKDNRSRDDPSTGSGSGTSSVIPHNTVSLSEVVAAGRKKNRPKK